MAESSVNSLHINRMKRRLGWLLVILAVFAGVLMSQKNTSLVRLEIESVTPQAGTGLYEVHLCLRNLSERRVLYSWGRLQVSHYKTKRDLPHLVSNCPAPRGNQIIHPGQSHRQTAVVAMQPDQLFSMQIYRYRDPTIRDHLLHWLSSHSPTVGSRRWFREKMRPNSVGVSTPLVRPSQLAQPSSTRESVPDLAGSGP